MIIRLFYFRVKIRIAFVDKHFSVNYAKIFIILNVELYFIAGKLLNGEISFLWDLFADCEKKGSHGVRIIFLADASCHMRTTQDFHSNNYRSSVNIHRVYGNYCFEKSSSYVELPAMLRTRP